MENKVAKRSTPNISGSKKSPWTLVLSGPLTPNMSKAERHQAAVDLARALVSQERPKPVETKVARKATKAVETTGEPAETPAAQDLI
ncbi:MAG: hypothetical protein ACM3X4_00555 [Ignavibacteriales bacterium]